MFLFCREKRRKPKFIVTLEGVGHDFEEKYEKEHLRKKKRRRASHKEESILNENVPTIPVYPPLIQGVHQVPGIHLPALNPVQPPIQMIPATMMAQLPVDPARHSGKSSIQYNFSVVKDTIRKLDWTLSPLFALESH